jgi:hypothetical protein
MLRSKLIATLFTILIFKAISFAQMGSVTGTVVDDATGEPLTSALITCTSASGGAYSDIEGKFTANFEGGTRDIKFKLVSYNEIIKMGVQIPTGGTVDVGEIRLVSKAEVKSGVTVRVKRSGSTEAAILAERKNATTLMDGTSKQAIAQVGDGDAAAAASRVTGVSIEGGKYVFVRGLGDRYTKTVLNGMELPGLDPDKNTVQMDIFPTNLIDNIVVLKSFLPNLSGDFTGGWVDVQTSDFQAKEVFGVSASLGYNPAMNLKSDYLNHGGGIRDIFALGKGSRALPFAEAQDINSFQYTTAPELAEENIKAFNNELATTAQMNMLNSSFSINYGNQINKNKKTYGYNFAGGYSNSFKYYENAIFQSYIKEADKTINELLLTEENNGRIGENEVLWSALANGSYKKGRHSLSSTVFHTQNGVKKSSVNRYKNIASPFGDAGAEYDRTVLYYNQRTLTSLLLEHTLKNDTGWTFTSRLSPSFSSNEEPDMRITVLNFDEEEGRYKFDNGGGSSVTRLFRNLTEFNLNAKWDAERMLPLSGKKETKIKFGFANNIKNRDFSVFEYVYNVPIGNVSLNGDPNQISEEYLFDASTGEGFTLYGQLQPSNAFNATMNVAAVYAMNEYPVTRRLNAIYGVRLEKADMFYTGQNTQGVVFNNEKVLDEMNVLPSLNLVFKATSDINIRLAGTRTLARPSFKEKSLAEIVDPISRQIFIGNIDLKQTEITNFDFRLEKFMKLGELVSISGFYKYFINPIEIVAFQPESPTNFTPRNAVSANVYGAEFELKKGLKALGMEKLFVATNVSYIYSQVEMTIQEIEGKTNEARVGQDIGTTREMQGQAPYIINVGINYDNKEKGVNANMSYNVQGPKLAIVGIGRLADVYTESFHSLNLKASYSFLEEDKAQLSFSIDNILADDNLQVYRNFEAQDQIFTQLLPQRTFKVGFSYEIK